MRTFPPEISDERIVFFKDLQADGWMTERILQQRTTTEDNLPPGRITDVSLLISRPKKNKKRTALLCPFVQIGTEMQFRLY
jgi:hypothetical protein